MASGSIRGITIEIEGKTSGLVKSLDAVNKELKNTQGNLKTVNAALKLDPSNLETLKTKQELLSNAIAQTKEKLELEKQAAQDAAKALQDGTITQGEYDTLQAEVAKTTAELKNLEAQAGSVATAIKTATGSAAQSVNELGVSIENAGKKLQTMGTDISKFGNDMSKVGGTVTKTVTTPIIGLGTAAVKSSLDFETAMAKVSTIADETVVSYDDMQKAIIDLSNETGIAATEIADAVYNAISAGQNTADAVSFVSNATSLAKAGFAETSSTLDVLTTIMNAYGMSANEVGRVSDVLIQTQNLGKTTVAELSSSMGKLIPTANASNVSLENVAAAYAILTMKGLKTAEATTYTNSMFSELSKSSTKVAKILKEQTGSSFEELMANGASLSEVLDILSDAAAKDGIGLKELFGSAEAGSAAISILGDDVNEFNEFLKQMQDASGATQTAFDKIDATKAEQAKKTLNQIKNTMTELGTVIMEVLGPVIEELSSIIRDVCTWFKELDEEEKQNKVKILALIAAIGPLLAIFGKLISSIGLIVSGLGKTTTGIGSLVKWVGGTLMPLITGSVVPFITGTLIPTIAAVAGPILALIAVITAVILVIENWDAIVEKSSEIFAAFRDFLLQAGTQIKEGLVAAFTFIRDKALEIWTGIKETISGIWTNIKDGISEKITNIKNNITDTFNNIKTAVTEKVGNIKDSIIEGVQNAIDFLTGLPAQALQWGKDLIDGFIEGIKSKVNAVVDAVKGVADKVTSFLHFSRPDEGPLRYYEEWMPDMMQGLAAGIRDNIGVIESALQTVTGTMSSQMSNPKDYSPELAGIKSSIDGMSGESGDIVIPVYIGDERIDTIVVNATQRMNYRSGGR